MSHMNHPLIGIDKLLADSWNAMFKEWKPTLGWTLGLLFVPFLINIAFALPIIAEPKLSNNIFLQLTSFILVWALSLFFQAGLFRYFLDRSKAVSVSIQDIVSLAWIGALTTIILIPAFLLFIFPGIWLAVAFSLAMPIYLKEGKGGWQAIKTSYEIVKGRWWATLVRYIVPNIVYGIGFSVILGIAMVITFAIAMIPLSSVLQAMEQGAEPMMALGGLDLVSAIGSLLLLLGVIILSMIGSILLTLAQTSVWTIVYKSLSETAGK